MIQHTLKKMFLTTGLCALGLLAACGGGGGSAGTSVFENGASTPTGPVAADLIVQVSSTELQNSGSDPVTVTVTAVDANRQTISGAPVSLSVNGDAIVSATGTATGTDGKVVGTVSAGSNRSNRAITVAATSGSITRSLVIQVVGAKLAGTAAPAVVLNNGAGTVTFQLTDKVNAGIANQPIQIVATQLIPASVSGVTNVNGEFVYNYTAPASGNGAAQVTATAGGATNTQIIQIGSSAAVPDAVGTIQSASVQAVPSVVSVNQPNSTTNRAEIRALFVGPGNIPVPNVRVRFDLGANQSGADGTFASGNSIIYSNNIGVATTSYTPKLTPSPTNGVRVRACYALNDAGLVNCPTFVETTLTVSASPMNITIGHDGTIEVRPLVYRKHYVVSIADSAGQPMVGVPISRFIELSEYGRGRFGFAIATAPAVSLWTKTASAWCPSEDTSGNQVLEVGEDINGNGRLDPGVADVTITLVDTETKSDGTAELYIQYPQSYATWAVAKITVTASVGGTEGRHTLTVSPLPAPDNAFTNGTNTPPFVTSPYGTTPNCTSPF